MWLLFKRDNFNNRTCSITSSFVNFEQISHLSDDFIKINHQPVIKSFIYLTIKEITFSKTTLSGRKKPLKKCLTPCTVSWTFCYYWWLVCIDERLKTIFLTRNISVITFQTLHKKWSFPLRISSVNMTKSAVRICSHLLKKSIMEKFIFCAVREFVLIIVSAYFYLFLIYLFIVG